VKHEAVNNNLLRMNGVA